MPRPARPAPHAPLALACALACALAAPACGDERAHRAVDIGRGADVASARPLDEGADRVAPIGDAGPDSASTTALGDADASAPGDVATATDVAGDGSDTTTLAPGLGTFENPIVVSALPFDDARDTRLAPSPVFDRYACDGDSDEGGDGFVYRIDVPVAGVFGVTLDDRPGDDIDVDVHLLGDDDPAACIVRDNLGLAFALEPGTYWVVVDTWVGPDGHPLAGPYHIHMTLTDADASTAPLGSLANPIGIASFPFSDVRDTKHAPGSKADRYACAPNSDERGGEFVYRLALPSAGTLTATLDDVPGDAVDVDVQLMTSPDPASCVARGNVTLSHAVTAGTYWLTVDTWIDSNGVAHAGPYHLIVDFAPDDQPPTGVGTVANPIAVAALPYSDARTTADAPSVALDHYACAPGIDEGGPEVVYAVHVANAGILVASVSDLLGDTTDVDVHLLAGSDAASCLARDNRSLALPVAPGNYRIVVDSFVDGSGTAMAGPYRLDVALVPTPDLARGCIMFYGDTRDDGAGQVGHGAVARAMAARCPAATLIHTGDYVGSGTSTADWDEFWQVEGALHSPTRRLLPTRGNHDGSWSNLVQRLGDAVDGALPDAQYVRPLGPGLWFIGLDSEGDIAAGSALLHATLDDPQKAGDRFVVAFHRPLYPSVGGHAPWLEGQGAWGTQFAAHAGKVVVVTGHDHGLSRESVDGVRYVTAGGGGAPLYGCSQIHTGTRFCQSLHGYTVCDLDLRCETWRVDDDGSETLLDAFDGP
ncbi:MAG: metallophosphoesterase [Myxococcota bacterium]